MRGPRVAAVDGDAGLAQPRARPPSISMRALGRADHRAEGRDRGGGAGHVVAVGEPARPWSSPRPAPR